MALSLRHGLVFFVYFGLGFGVCLTYYIWVMYLSTEYPTLGGGNLLWGKIISDPANANLLKLYFVGFTLAPLGFFMNLPLALKLADSMSKARFYFMTAVWALFMLTSMFWMHLSTKYLEYNPPNCQIDNCPDDATAEGLFFWVEAQLLCSGILAALWAASFWGLSEAELTGNDAQEDTGENASNGGQEGGNNKDDVNVNADPAAEALLNRSAGSASNKKRKVGTLTLYAGRLGAIFLAAHCLLLDGLTWPRYFKGTHLKAVRPVAATAGGNEAA